MQSLVIFCCSYKFDTSIPRHSPSIITSSAACLKAVGKSKGCVSSALGCVLVLMKSIRFKISLIERALRYILKYLVAMGKFTKQIRLKMAVAHGTTKVVGSWASQSLKMIRLRSTSCNRLVSTILPRFYC